MNTINARYQLERNDFVLDVDFSFPAQGVTAIYGPSGSGKTTLLRLMAGLEHSRDGLLSVDNECWQKGAFSLATHRRSLGYVFQEPSLFAHLNVHRNIQYGLKRVKSLERNDCLQSLVQLLGLENLLERYPHQLSGGEQQRVAIARALAVNPKLLLMDEPLASLDVDRKKEVLPFLEALQKELSIPVLYVSHSLDEVARIADYLVYLQQGRVSSSGPINSMLARLDLPLAHEQQAVSVIETTVVEYDQQYRLCYLDSTFGRFSIVSDALSVGEKVKLQLAARDISLTLQPQQQTSILNIFPAVIDEIVEQGPAQAIVRLAVGDTYLLARLTRKSVDALSLKPGVKVFAQAKSVALLL